MCNSKRYFILNWYFKEPWPVPSYKSRQQTNHFEQQIIILAINAILLHWQHLHFCKKTYLPSREYSKIANIKFIKALVGKSLRNKYMFLYMLNCYQSLFKEKQLQHIEHETCFGFFDPSKLQSYWFIQKT